MKIYHWKFFIHWKRWKFVKTTHYLSWFGIFQPNNYSALISSFYILILYCTLTCIRQHSQCLLKLHVSCLVTKATKWHVRPAKTQISLGFHPARSRDFAVRMKKAKALSYPLTAQRRLIRLGGCPGWSESSLGTQPHCWFCHEAAHALLN